MKTIPLVPGNPENTEPEKTFQWKDKTGRGFKNKLTLQQINDNGDEFSWDGESLHEWAELAEEGDVWEDAENKYTCL